MPSIILNRTQIFQLGKNVQPPLQHMSMEIFLHSWFSLNVLEVSNVHFNYENIISLFIIAQVLSLSIKYLNSKISSRVYKGFSCGIP